MKWGSLPNRFAFQNETAIKNYLNGVYDSIILRDVIERLKIRDVSTLTIYSYLDALCKALLIKTVYRYDIQVKQY